MPERLRVDKWLWYARFFKTRSLASTQVSAGHVRLNGARLHKPATAVAPGDVLTFAQGQAVRVIRIEALAERRGPAPEAQALYTDLEPPERPEPQDRNPGFDGKGRPSGKDRRTLDKSRLGRLE